MFQSLPVSEFEKYLQQDNVVLLDVRTPEELEIFGTISDTQLHIDCSRPENQSAFLDLDRSKKYALYCFHGNRSRQIGQWLDAQGFDCVDLQGGIAAFHDEK